MTRLIAQPPTSRAGLIATIVVSFVLNGVLAVLYFKQCNETVKLQGEAADLRKEYAQAVAEPVMASPEYGNLKDQARAAGNVSVYEVLSGQRSNLAVLVAGQPMSSPEVARLADQANRQANAALQDAAGKAGLSVAPGGSLVETLGRWPAVVNQVFDQRERLKIQAAADEARMSATESAHRLALAEKDKAIADARADAARVNVQLDAAQQRNERALGDVQDSARRAAGDQSRQLEAEEISTSQKDRDNADLRKEVAALKLALRKFKANLLTRETIVRVPNGQIKAIAGNECFIDLGKGDQLPVGMTFEVYDANRGIPPLGEGGHAWGVPAFHSAAFSGSLADSYASDLPVGKGAIEVVSVGPDHTSECRIVHVEPGQLIGPGDLIANLVYDRNAKLNFFVHGEFDLGRGGGAVSGAEDGRSDKLAAGTRGNDAGVIRRLIEQWGGQVQPIAEIGDPASSVTPDTDFVIVGKEPRMPNYSDEEIRTRPEIGYEMDKFRKRLEAYRDVLARAAKYGIPVLNQNRFLYYTGFFDQAKR